MNALIEKIEITVVLKNQVSTINCIKYYEWMRVYIDVLNKVLSFKLLWIIYDD